MTTTGDRPPHYVPLLKGRQGEFSALKHVAPADRLAMTPLVEVPTTAVRADDDGDVDPASVDAALETFVERVIGAWDPGPRIIVDAASMPRGLGDASASLALIARFERASYRVVPTVRPSDDPDDIDRMADVLARRNGWDGACIRLAGEDLDDTDTPLSDLVEALVRALRLAPADIDLVLDLGSVADDRTASFAGRVARLVLNELPYVHQWRTLTLAAGAFPPDLGAVPPNVLTEVPRFDASMWKAVRDRWGHRNLDFGDYAIAHPVLGSGVPFAPAPQVRYTTPDAWLVVKGRRAERRGAAQFFDICARIAAQPTFAPGLSWGDDYIAAAAESAGRDAPQGDVGPGNAMTWRAIGTSHHLAFVIRRLATAAAP